MRKPVDLEIGLPLANSSVELNTVGVTSDLLNVELGDKERISHLGGIELQCGSLCP